MAREKKNVFFGFPLLFLLLISCFCSLVAAVPVTRSLISLKNHEAVLIPIAMQALSREPGAVAEGSGRMGMELNDYPGSGPNPRHDPKNPPAKP